MTSEGASRYVIGIDLGTTNSAVAYIDTDVRRNPTLSVQTFPIPQQASDGTFRSLPMLPSFCYLQPEKDNGGSNYVVGAYAREAGARLPTRLVRSAKSWLCNDAANRREKILPFECSEGHLRISPVEATTRYLKHIKEAWDSTHGKDDPLAEFNLQDIVITVPASFDEVARTLTAEAAKSAGYVNMTLLEEPQAAFYSWILQNEREWESQLPIGSTILVCDVGGGTTDFSLIEVKADAEGKRSFQRLAVGRHLILGGDNMDAALCHWLEQQLRVTGKIEGELDLLRWHRLHHEARNAKEQLLGGSLPRYTVTLQGLGSHVVGGTTTLEVKAEDVAQLLSSGFFGMYDWNEAQHLDKGSGIRTMGLAYESDASITKHLAQFLCKAKSSGPDYVLFNGGTMKPQIFQDAVTSSLEAWHGKKPAVLSSYSLDLAVARGAAYFGKVRRGLGVRIGGGAARNLYMGIDAKKSDGTTERQALTLIPRGSEEGSTYQAPDTFLLSPNRPVIFPLYSSHVRLGDAAGDRVCIANEEMTPLPPIQTILRYGKGTSTTETIPVSLEASLTHVGTLDLWLTSQVSTHRWKLEFQLRSTEGNENSLAVLDKGRLDDQVDVASLTPAQEHIRATFNDRSSKPKTLMDQLEQLLDVKRLEWSPQVLRSLGQTVLEVNTQRKNSVEHESRWWNLIGFCLRPGFGYPLDDFRIKELWKIILSDRSDTKSGDILLQRWICYRRVAGGFSKGQQQQIAGDLLPLLFNKKGKIEIKGKSEEYAYAEKIRAIASMERLDIVTKVKVGDALVNRIACGEALPADYWALARLGARHVLYGSLSDVVPRDTCAGWLEKIIKDSKYNEEQLPFVLAQLARKTDHRDINLCQETMDKIGSFLLSFPGTDALQHLLQHESPLSPQEQDRLLGDQLPAGLTLHC